MINRIIITYTPGYFSNYINLEEIKVIIDKNNITYEEVFFDEVDEVEGHLSSWSKNISKFQFDFISKACLDLKNIENEYEYYDSEITHIECINDDASSFTIDLYCNLNKNSKLSLFVKSLGSLLTAEYLLPSMIGECIYEE